ncbi:MAG: hypothetical protein LBV61_05985 [Burkholderiaceae bacterium]|nr:hypothetical protein [Burkholderiaceae bacterium]
MACNLFTAFFGIFSASDQHFEAKQVWQYKTRPGESDSRLYIIKAESWPNGERIFHIYVDKLKIKNPMLADGVQTVVPHAPVSEQTLKLSVTRFQKKTDVLPDIAEGYSAWKEQYDQGGAGVFTISVSEIINIIEGAVTQHAKPHS